MKNKNELEKVIKSLHEDYWYDLEENAPYEKEFKDVEKHWYSPFILWTRDDVESLQPSDVEEFSQYIAIGSNGGMETYLLSIKDGSVFVCDMISGIKSKQKIATSYAELLSLI